MWAAAESATARLNQRDGDVVEIEEEPATQFLI